MPSVRIRGGKSLGAISGRVRHDRLHRALQDVRVGETRGRKRTHAQHLGGANPYSEGGDAHDDCKRGKAKQYKEKYAAGKFSTPGSDVRALAPNDGTRVGVVGRHQRARHKQPLAPPGCGRTTHAAGATQWGWRRKRTLASTKRLSFNVVTLVCLDGITFGFHVFLPTSLRAFGVWRRRSFVCCCRCFFFLFYCFFPLALASWCRRPGLGGPQWIRGQKSKTPRSN